MKLNLLFSSTYWSGPDNEDAKEAKKVALHTLDAMADGGIHDHINKVSDLHVLQFIPVTGKILFFAWKKKKCILFHFIYA